MDRVLRIDSISIDSVVHVVDDDPQILQGVARLLRASGYFVRTHLSARSLLDEPDIDVPGCIILDVSMPELSGLDVQAELSRSDKQRPIVFITGLNDARIGVTAMKAGAIDFLMKPFDESELLGAVRTAINKDRVQRDTRAQSEQLQKRLATLTKRELEVMLNVVAGHLNKQIAAELGIAEKTVKVHRQRVMEKMQAASLAELVRLTYQAETASTH